ncbi:CD82 antigen-like [Mizuhopecten yessoensis]|uniref:CD82 antigen-like n=1 Tax=Mizuhopecten yessoensis TaxID=6573 RepID=UPI000B45B8E9|nr:CD82 antigen-like [Mizuhopecten yessoensis]
MKVDIKPSPLRWFLFAINIIFFLLGFALVAAGFAVKVKGDLINGPVAELLRELNTQQDGATLADMLVTLSNLFIAIGLAGLVVSLIGCSGAGCSWRSCLIAYGIDVIIVIVLAVVAGVLAWFLGSGELAYLENSMKANIQRSYRGSQASDTASLAWNYLFFSLGCCGATSYMDLDDWNRTALVGQHHNITLQTTTPLFCCKGLKIFSDTEPPKGDNNWNCAAYPKERNSNFLTGCAKQLSTKLKEYSATLFVLGGIYTLIMICCASSSILLFVIMGRRTHEEIDPGGFAET